MIGIHCHNKPMTDYEPIPPPTNFHDQAEHSWTLPAYWYTDSKVFEKEKKQIFYKNWWYVGTVRQLSKPGQIFTTTVVDQEVFVIRGEDNVLRAFYQENFRGTRGVKDIEDFNPSNFGLESVRVETLIGLVFVNLDANADALTDISESMVKDMRAYCPRLDDLVLSKSYELQTAANWKTLVDNNLESYHSAVAHPSLMGLLDYSTFEVWEDRFTTCHAMTNSNLDNPAYKVDSKDSVKRAIYSWLWPNTAFFIAPGPKNLGVFQMVPTGPESSLQRWEFYFENEQPTESEQAYLDWTINTLIPEDTALYENVQHGLRSQGYSQGRFVINRNRPEWSEHHVHQFQTLVRDAIMADC